MKAIILVGGEATRLRPLTCNIPKIMVPVLNRPLLEHIIGYLKSHGILDVVLAVGKSPEHIQRHFRDGSKLGVKITYSVEDYPRGTAGAVKNAERFGDGSFVVLNGDVFSDLDLGAMIERHRRSRPIATLALTPVEDPSSYGVVETDADGRVKRFIEKPKPGEVTTNMINAGVYVLEPEILSYISPDGFIMFERDIFPLLLEKGQVMYGYAFQGYWIDMGTPDKYLRLNWDLLRRPALVRARDKGVEFEGKSFVNTSARIEGPAIIGQGCFIGANSLIKGPAVLGARCQVEEGAMIEGAILWEDCRVGKNSKLRNCVLASRCHVEDASEVLDGCLIGDGVRIGSGNRLCNGIKIWPNSIVPPNTISF